MFKKEFFYVFLFLAATLVLLGMSIAGKPYFIESAIFFGITLTMYFLVMLVKAFNQFIEVVTKTFNAFGDILDFIKKTNAATPNIMANPDIQSFIIKQDEEGNFTSNIPNEDFDKIMKNPLFSTIFKMMEKTEQEEKDITKMTKEELEKELKSATTSENYERAALIKEEIEKRKNPPTES